MLNMARLTMRAITHALKGTKRAVVNRHQINTMNLLHIKLYLNTDHPVYLNAIVIIDTSVSLLYITSHQKYDCFLKRTRTFQRDWKSLYHHNSLRTAILNLFLEFSFSHNHNLPKDVLFIVHVPHERISSLSEIAPKFLAT